MGNFIEKCDQNLKLHLCRINLQRWKFVVETCLNNERGMSICSEKWKENERSKASSLDSVEGHGREECIFVSFFCRTNTDIAPGIAVFVVLGRRPTGVE